MNKFTKVLNIVTLGAWIAVFLEAIFQDLNAYALREIAIVSSFVVIMDLIFEMLGNREERIKKEALVKRIYDFIGKEKQGDK